MGAINGVGEEANKERTKEFFAKCNEGTETIAFLNDLLKFGINLNDRNDQGLTPLMKAAEHGHSTIVSKIISRDADVNAENGPEKMTALIYAAHGDHTETMQKLIENGAVLSAKEKSSLSPFQMSLVGESGQATAYLLDCGVEITTMDISKITEFEESGNLLQERWQTHQKKTYDRLTNIGVSKNVIDELQNQYVVSGGEKPEDMAATMNRFQGEVLTVANEAEKLKDAGYDLSKITSIETKNAPSLKDYARTTLAKWAHKTGENEGATLSSVSLDRDVLNLIVEQAAPEASAKFAQTSKLARSSVAGKYIDDIQQVFPGISKSPSFVERLSNDSGIARS